MGIWLTGYERVDLGLDGKAFETLQNPKGLLHSTEGTSLAGAEAAMRAYPSHGGYDFRTRDKHQYISLDQAAYSAMDESDDDPIYQWELVGFAKDMRFLPDWALKNIAEDVIKPLADAVGIPPVIIGSGFKDGLDGVYPYLATPESPIRLSYAGLRAFSGWLGHQHLPAPDSHWDPGAIDMARLIELAYTETSSPSPRKRRNSMIFTAEVISNPIPAGDPRLAGTSLTGGVPVGFSALFDTTNLKTTGLSNASNTRTGSKDAFVPHYGLTGAEFLDFVKKYTTN